MLNQKLSQGAHNAQLPERGGKRLIARASGSRPLTKKTQWYNKQETWSLKAAYLLPLEPSILDRQACLGLQMILRPPTSNQRLSPKSSTAYKICTHGVPILKILFLVLGGEYLGRAWVYSVHICHHTQFTFNRPAEQGTSCTMSVHHTVASLSFECAATISVGTGISVFFLTSPCSDSFEYSSHRQDVGGTAALGRAIKCQAS